VSGAHSTSNHLQLLSCSLPASIHRYMVWNWWIPRRKRRGYRGLEIQINEIKEAVELPLKRPELSSGSGFILPKESSSWTTGTGKTLLAKAVAHETNAHFMRVVGSELVQKYIGEGPDSYENFLISPKRRLRLSYLSMRSMQLVHPALSPIHQEIVRCSEHSCSFWPHGRV